MSIAICLLPTLFFEKKVPHFSQEFNRTIYMSPIKYTATNRQCELYKDLNFVVTSSLLSFYIPLIIMIFLYAKVLYAIRQQSLKINKKPSNQLHKKTTGLTLKRQKQKKENLCWLLLRLDQQTENFVHQSMESPSKSKSLFPCCFNSEYSEKTNSSHRKHFLKQHQLDCLSNHSLTNEEIQHSDQQQLGRKEITAEARVTRSLAVVIGCFICCWLPFFTLYIIRAVCLCLSFNAIEFFVWLGYSNSSINPVLYAILNKNFRLAFKNIFISAKKFIF